MKIVINTRYGGFGVSEDVYKELGIPWDGYGFLDNSQFDIESDNYNKYRSDPALIRAIEKLGTEKASGECSELKIIEIPDGTNWEIQSYNGAESIHQVHLSWY